MGNNFYADYGLFAKANFNTQTHIFYGLKTNHIMRVDLNTYSIFTNYTFNNITYALSLDFDIDLLQALLDNIAPYFSDKDMADMIIKLLDPAFRHNIIEWNSPIGDINCLTSLGEMQKNENESYIPFVVQKFI